MILVKSQARLMFQKPAWFSMTFQIFLLKITFDLIKLK